MFRENACHKISINDTKICFDNLPQKCFCFFFQPQIEFCSTANKQILKKVFCMHNLTFCVHNVNLDTTILAFFFSLNFFSKTQKIYYFFCIACLCMPWSMSANMKYQKVRRTIIEKFCQNLEVCYFSYIIWERQLGCLRRILNARPSNLCCFEQPRSLLLCSVVNTTQRFSENKLRNKKIIFGLWTKHPFMGKCLS